jgi:hypothetical protein
MLGMKSRYVEGQVDGARRGYRKFRRLLGAGLAVLPEGRPVSGGMQSDAASLQFATVDDALLVGRAIFLAAFESGGRMGRSWLRGVILEHGWPASVLQRNHPLPNAPDGLFETRFSEHLLNAINVEQSGFKGQRLLIEGSIATEATGRRLAVKVGGGNLAPFRRLGHSHYPTPTCDGFRDVLWMLPDNPADWPNHRIRMLDLLRWSSGGGPAELEQAAATHLAFAEVDAILEGSRRRSQTSP